MKIVAISDTHNYHRELNIPEADLLIHAGDITKNGELSVIADFAGWLKNLPISKSIVIFGNHELGFESGPNRNTAIKLIEDAGATYLEDSGIEIDGTKIWGSPVQPFFYNWEFNRHRGKEIDVHWQKIPNDINVLITHGPPYGILDQAPRSAFSYENVGCKDLSNKIKQLSALKAHIFGHIHNSYSFTPQIVNGVKYINASSCNERYKAVNPPVVFEI